MTEGEPDSGCARAAPANRRLRDGRPRHWQQRRPADGAAGLRRPPHRAVRRRAGQDARRRRSRHPAGRCRCGGAGGHSQRRRAGPARRRRRGRGIGGATCAGQPQPRPDLDDRSRLPRHDHAAGHPPRGTGGSRLVHRVHALPARDFAGSAGSPDQLPDPRVGPHRSVDRRRVVAGRTHCRRRGHVAVSTSQ